MKHFNRRPVRRTVFVLVLALLCAAPLVGARSSALAAPSLAPEQHVYPTSSLAEIQHAIDIGGTVYFDYGDYYQLAAASGSGFQVGRFGNAVDIVGLTGPAGERPRIFGGMVPFRVGKIPGLGGTAVDFRIENLELTDPEVATWPWVLNSRVGILVFGLGMRSTIANCAFTITGRDTDVKNSTNHSAAIWFILQGAVAAAPEGATVAITGNRISTERALTAIAFGHFRPETETYTAPRVAIEDNVIDVNSLRGYGNEAAAIILTGNHSNTTVANNRVTGDARGPGVPAGAIALEAIASAPSAGTTVTGNDTSRLTGNFQLFVSQWTSGATVLANGFGSVAGEAAIQCNGHENAFTNNHFFGDYPGAAGGGPGLFWFTATSDGNIVTATKLNGPPYGRAVCGQVRDDSGLNLVPGQDRCR